ncbi:hypothetical protein Tco_1317744 [Tanacetum coccineum]
MPTEMELTLEQTQQGVSYEVSVIHKKMEILLEPTSNKLMVGSLPHGFRRKHKMEVWRFYLCQQECEHDQQESNLLSSGIVEHDTDSISVSMECEQ